jgi:hypothetical protein
MISPNLSVNEDHANKEIHETTKIEEKDDEKNE